MYMYTSIYTYLAAYTLTTSWDCRRVGENAMVRDEISFTQKIVLGNHSKSLGSLAIIYLSLCLSAYEYLFLPLYVYLHI